MGYAGIIEVTRWCFLVYFEQKCKNVVFMITYRVMSFNFASFYHNAMHLFQIHLLMFPPDVFWVLGAALTIPSFSFDMVVSILRYTEHDYIIYITYRYNHVTGVCQFIVWNTYAVLVAYVSDLYARQVMCEETCHGHALTHSRNELEVLLCICMVPGLWRPGQWNVHLSNPRKGRTRVVNRNSSLSFCGIGLIYLSELGEYNKIQSKWYIPNLCRKLLDNKIQSRGAALMNPNLAPKLW